MKDTPIFAGVHHSGMGKNGFSAGGNSNINFDESSNNKYGSRIGKGVGQ